MIPRGVGFLIMILIIDSLFGKKAKENREKKAESRENQGGSSPFDSFDFDELKESFLGMERQAKDQGPKVQEQEAKSKEDEIRQAKIQEKDELQRRRMKARRAEIKRASRAQKREFKESLVEAEIGDGLQSPRKKTKSSNYKESRKKDLLRGIIFSEILSEPKSIENRKKSI